MKNNLSIKLMCFILVIVAIIINEVLGLVLFGIFIGYLIYSMIYHTSSSDKLITYIIRRGNHYSSGKLFGLLNFGIIFKDLIYRIQGTVIIHESMYYNDIAGWNKIIGYNGLPVIKNPAADGFVPKNEIYLAWRCEKRKLKLGIYTRVNGVICEQAFNTIFAPGDYVHYKISECNDQYVLTIMKETGKPVTETLCIDKCKDNFDIGIRLKSYPYFGGRMTAPHDIKVQIIK